MHDGATCGLGAADIDLVNELVYGVLRWQASLDHVIESHARRSATGIDLALLVALRIGLYQIRYLSRVPERAAVDESVKLAHRFGRRGGSKLVNAVLRSVCRQPEQPVMPTKEADALAYLTVTLSHPEWLARRYLARMDFLEAEALCLRNNRRPPTDLRIEPPLELETAREALSREGITAAPLALLPRCLRVETGKATSSKLYAQGNIFIQEAGSQLIPFLLDASSGDSMLDACAAPGAKTTEIAPWIHPAMMFAVDERPKRLSLMAALARRLGSGTCSRSPRTRAPFHFTNPSLASCWTRRARAWARWRATRTSSGGCGRRISPGTPRSSINCWKPVVPCCLLGAGWSTRLARASPRRTKRSSLASCHSTKTSGSPRKGRLSRLRLRN